MPGSVNEYASERSSVFFGIAELADSKNVKVVGRTGDNGLVTELNERGQVLWSREYILDGERIYFNHAINVGGGAILLGRLAVPAARRAHHLIMRITKDGTPVWTRRIFTNNSRSNVALAKLGQNYVLAGWNNVSGTSDDIEIHKISGSGDLIASVVISLGGDDQVESIIAVNGQIVIIGGTSASRPWSGFLLRIDTKLEVKQSLLIKQPNNEAIINFKAVIADPKSRKAQLFILGTSRIGNYTHSLLLTIEILADGINLSGAVEFDVTKGNDFSRKIVRGGDALFILGNDLKTSRPYVVKFSKALEVEWVKTFELENDYRLVDMEVRNSTEILLAGYSISRGKKNTPLLISTDPDLNTCKTVDRKIVRATSTSLRSTNAAADSRQTEITALSLDPRSIELSLQIRHLCSDTVFGPTDSAWLQSPYLYIQAAGSSGDVASAGILLRWFLLGKLGDSHLPKGEYANNRSFFNRPDDYVRVYRRRYRNPVYRVLDFTVEKPIYIDTDSKLRWIYDVNGQLYYLNFQDVARYRAVQSTMDPSGNPYAFISAYGDGILEIEIRGNLAFSVELGVSGDAAGSINVETFSVQGDAPVEESAMSCRKSFGAVGDERLQAHAENIRFIKLQSKAGPVRRIAFEMYADAINVGPGDATWSHVGDFALSHDTPEVFSRLEDPATFQVHGYWQKYNDDAYVNVHNYRERWLSMPEGLRQGVVKYLQLSETDPAASELTPEDDGAGSMNISYLSLLNLVSLDFHIARMLGLGTIDPAGVSDSDKFIYLAEYVTEAALDEGGAPVRKQHLYLTLPTARNDSRLPRKLTTLPVSYGINIYQGTDTPFQLTDDQGYLPYEPVRYVNVHGRPAVDTTVYHGFFQPPTEFCLCDGTEPVFAGIEYRKQTEGTWRMPEISSDENYKDAGVGQHFETVPLPLRENPTAPLYAHREMEDGIHEYSLYGINIFSIASQTNNSVFTDITEFTEPNTLLSPHNIHVQLIQPEGPLLLTTDLEQQMLGDISGTDKTLVRLTFNYNHLHDINYQFGDTVEIFFRDTLPRIVEGGVLSVEDSGDAHAILSTQDYVFDSTGMSVTPVIPDALGANFVGGVLVVNGVRHLIDEVIQTTQNGDHPKLRIRKLVDRNVTDLGGGELVTTQASIPIDAAHGDFFTIFENMSLSQNWGDWDPVTQNMDDSEPLSMTVQLGGASWAPQFESYENPEGRTVTNNIGGLWDTANITLKSIDGTAPSQTGVYEVVTAIYEVEFDTESLGHHAQSIDDIDWYKGVIRIPKIGDVADELEKKVLDVVSIENLGASQKLKLLIADESHLSGSPDNLENIKTGAGVSVNYHPGYRIYLREEATRGFDANNIFPASGEGSRKTIIGLRTLDSTTQDSNGKNYHSPVSAPQMLFALEIVEPLPPQLPIGPSYATPPDFYGKCTCTFTTTFRSETVGAVFYRADVNAVLQTLYKPATITQIKAALPPPDEDPYYSDRLRELVSFNYTTQNGKFTEFPLGDSVYGLPNPDNPDNGFDINGADDPADVSEDIKDAILASFLPLTEQPLIFMAIKGGDYIPTNKKQNFRDQHGKLLDPSDPRVDLAPMAKKHDGTDDVTFTDFTLDGEMSKDTAYFYCVREMGSRLSLSDPSPVFGPVKLINKNPPEAPIIRKVTSQPEQVYIGRGVSVVFEVNAYVSHQNIKRAQIYRALKAVDALTPKTMQLVKEIDLTSLVVVDGLIEIVDDFSADSLLPYGEPLFYKIVALREVIYSDAKGQMVTEHVPSKPSKTFLTNIIDVVNPAPPEILATNSYETSTEFVGLSLSWIKTAHNASYLLWKMNSAGNWNNIAIIKSNDQNDLTYTFDQAVPKYDNTGNRIYHRFKVSVENASGLLNTSDNILTL